MTVTDKPEEEHPIAKMLRERWEAAGRQNIHCQPDGSLIFTSDRHEPIHLTREQALELAAEEMAKEETEEETEDDED